MSERLQRIEAEALTLPPEEREALAGTLLDSLQDARLNDEGDASWVLESERRYRALKDGTDKGIPDEDFFPSVERELGCE